MNDVWITVRTESCRTSFIFFKRQYIWPNPTFYSSASGGIRNVVWRWRMEKRLSDYSRGWIAYFRGYLKLGRIRDWVPIWPWPKLSILEVGFLPLAFHLLTPSREEQEARRFTRNLTYFDLTYWTKVWWRLLLDGNTQPLRRKRNRAWKEPNGTLAKRCTRHPTYINLTNVNLIHANLS